MKIFISVVSHGHSALIKKLGCLDKLSKKFKVVLKLNKLEPEVIGDDFFKGMVILNENYGIGFGENNNVVYQYCVDNLEMNDDDLFIILNPDVIIDVETINSICHDMKIDRVNLATLNLFKDKDYKIYDNSVRKFPSFTDFLYSFISGKNKTVVDKSLVFEPQAIDWAAGSLLIFNSKHYRSLKGFDTKYFMYCEDIDICFRSSKLGSSTIYYPQYKAIHLAGHNNRNIFSKHFYWHVRSAIMFLVKNRVIM